MVKVRRANVVLHIPEHQIDRYLARGFNVVDEKDGHIVREAIPHDASALNAAYVKHTAEITKLKAEVERLGAELEEARKQKRKAKTQEE